MKPELNKRFWIALIDAWFADRCMSKAAALSFYTIFSLAPILVLLVVITGHFVDLTSAVNEITRIAQELIGPSGVSLLNDMLQSVHWNKPTGWPAIFALAMLLVGATSAFDELKDSLDDVWRAPKTSLRGMQILRGRFLAFVLIALLAILVLASLSIDTFLKLLSDNVLTGFGLGHFGLFRGFSTLITTGLIGIFFLLVFKLLPRINVSWRNAMRASALSTTLFLFGHIVIRLCIGSSSGLSVYGAAGSIAVLLLWVYYSAIVFFLSAEMARLWWDIGEK